ncbi:hypothetical protein SAMD00019534_064430 [Acytostelium subglobosum LB1]|uniref:hypothetical protein n=1 Tax=Acytostelium subglobosum LB1 TaxID=1410327 RepID=UPI000644BB4D|nr:hypothetical protein SAMD00019534_064430 [Acytostelium subglobosum LB1]GAM23268.1 hypothetical protein SAMD00019534_064430 [Acytostelium subglobosum LB1]|eukprot:XP_012753717.1 hypothetical protein SAMD00019534_064430 [Acytostelium subglobosum LB1]
MLSMRLISRYSNQLVQSFNHSLIFEDYSNEQTLAHVVERFLRERDQQLPTSHWHASMFKTISMVATCLGDLASVLDKQDNRDVVITALKELFTAAGSVEQQPLIESIQLDIENEPEASLIIAENIPIRQVFAKINLDDAKYEDLRTLEHFTSDIFNFDEDIQEYMLFNPNLEATVEDDKILPLFHALARHQTLERLELTERSYYGRDLLKHFILFSVLFSSPFKTLTWLHISSDPSNEGWTTLCRFACDCSDFFFRGLQRLDALCHLGLSFEYIMFSPREEHIVQRFFDNLLALLQNNDKQPNLNSVQLRIMTDRYSRVLEYEDLRPDIPTYLLQNGNSKFRRVSLYKLDRTFEVINRLEHLYTFDGSKVELLNNISSLEFGKLSLDMMVAIILSKDSAVRYLSVGSIQGYYDDPFDRLSDALQQNTTLERLSFASGSSYQLDQSPSFKRFINVIAKHQSIRNKTTVLIDINIEV